MGKMLTTKRLSPKEVEILKEISESCRQEKTDPSVEIQTALSNLRRVEEKGNVNDRSSTPRTPTESD